MIRAENIGKQFTTKTGDQVEALADFSFACKPGELVCLLGPTGCGKTTFLRLLAGLDTPGQGLLNIDGVALEGINTHAGFVFQQGALFPWLKAIENVAFALQMQGSDKQARRNEAARWLERVGLAGFENAYPHELSGGMAQRVALARALIAKPSMLLLDEPFGALDEKTRHEIQQMLLNLWKESGTTIVFVTHNVEEAVFLGQRIVVMGRAPHSFEGEIKITDPYPRDRLSKQFETLLLQVRQLFTRSIEDNKE